MIKNFGILLFFIGISCFSFANFPFKDVLWRAQLVRTDGNNIIFNFKTSMQKGKPVITIINADEKMLVDEIRMKKDSIFFKMPVFESEFKAKFITPDSLQGTWTRATSSHYITMPFTANSIEQYRFYPEKGAPLTSAAGRWSVTFNDENNIEKPAIGEFDQAGNKLTGSILTPTGDYRYLEGIVSGDSLLLSGFDGIHALLFTAKIINKDSIANGMFFSGPTAVRTWTAVKNNHAVLPDLAAMYLKDPEDDKPDFTFKSIDEKMISLHDKQFKNKVVIIQLMGSWCPNCMDETAFLSAYYNKNKQRGVEVIALAYELSDDFKRSQTFLRKFQQRFDVNYPILVTGVPVSDTLRTEKTLPLFTPIKTFPTSIILDKKGKVRKIDTGFFGPGTGEYYQNYVHEFELFMDKLIKE